jgi:hypothetical protein
VEQLLEVDELGHLALHQPGDGHTRPLADDLGDVLRVDLFLQHPPRALQLVEVRRRLVDATLDLGDPSVADLGCEVEVGLPLELEPELLELLLQRADRADGALLRLPVLAHLR